MHIQDYQLRADLQSLNRGLKYWYAGRSNPLLAKLLYDYFGKGKENHLITFSQFMYFLRDLKLHQYNQNMVVFRLLSEGKQMLFSHDLLRYYTQHPKNSPFHNEITKLLEHALNTYQRRVGADRHSQEAKKLSIVITTDYFTETIPFSELAQELIYKFIVIPERFAYDEGTGLFQPGFMDIEHQPETTAKAAENTTRTGYTGAGVSPSEVESSKAGATQRSKGADAKSKTLSK